MPATEARAQFVRQEFRLSTAPTVTAIETGFGDLARNTDTAPIETMFTNIADVESARTEAANVLTRDARLITQSTKLTSELLNLDFSSTTPSARAIDDELGLDRTGLVSAIAVDLIAEKIEVETWG